MTCLKGARGAFPRNAIEEKEYLQKHRFARCFFVSEKGKCLQSVYYIYSI